MAEIKWIKITTDIFDDEKLKIIDSMPARDEIIVIWFKLLALTGKVNENGLLYMSNKIPYTPEMLAAIFNRELSSIRLALSTFEAFGMITIFDNDVISISNWEKHQNIDGMDKIREQTRKRVADHREKQKILSNVTCNVTVTECNATEKDKDKDKDKDTKLLSSKKLKTVFNEESFEIKQSKYLYGQILLLNPNAKEPNFQSWASQIDKMKRLDNRNEEQITKVLKWACNDSFWQTNILSTGKLRTKFDALVIKMNSEAKPRFKKDKFNGYAGQRTETDYEALANKATEMRVKSG